ncbi:MAG: PVC-type heme-binding CxxCH protein, partial [Planctomycetia bacterium]
MRGRSLAIAGLLATTLAAAGPQALAQRGLRDIPTPDPEAERAALEVADGYEVNLFAADPLVSKPLQINFDPQGRMWVSSSSVYPQIRPGEGANDRVTILEDRDGDGRADGGTVFAEGLLMPTGVLPDDRGGAFVANSTELVHLTDTDGDGRADARRVVLSGFGAEDTHHIIHTFRRGPDARVYFNQSI